MDDDQQQQDQDMRKKTRVGTRLPPKNRKLFSFFFCVSLFLILDFFALR
jgi:hypothetical protein